MSKYAYEPKEAAALTGRFVYENIKEPLISILTYTFFTGLVLALFAKDHPLLALPIAIFQIYLGALFATIFHRAFIDGEEIEEFDPLHPTWEDWRYIGTLTMLCIASALIVFLTATTLALAFGKIGSTAVMLITAPLLIFISLRLSLIFADCAVGGKLGLLDAFYISRGLVLKIVFVPILAGWKIFLACVVWTAFARAIANSLINDRSSLIFEVAYYTLASPANLVGGYYLAALGVASVSNYYLWAMNNQQRV